MQMVRMTSASSDHCLTPLSPISTIDVIPIAHFDPVFLAIAGDLVIGPFVLCDQLQEHSQAIGNKADVSGDASVESRVRSTAIERRYVCTGLVSTCRLTQCCSPGSGNILLCTNGGQLTLPGPQTSQSSTSSPTLMYNPTQGVVYATAGTASANSLLADGLILNLGQNQSTGAEFLLNNNVFSQVVLATVAVNP